MNNTILTILVLLLLALAAIIWLRRRSPNAPETEQAFVDVWGDEPDLEQTAPSATPSTSRNKATPQVHLPVPEIKQTIPEVKQTIPEVKQAVPEIKQPLPEVKTPVPEPEPTGPDVDQEVLNQLREAGSDLSKPHKMEFLLYFPTQESATQVADKIKADGFIVEVKRATQGSAWLCLAVKKMVPKRSDIAVIGKRFSALAREFNGEYDGWETSLEK